MQYLVLRDPDPRPVLMVRTTADAEAELPEFKRSLYGTSCPLGLLIDGDQCLIVRDNFNDLTADSYEVDARLSTDAVLNRVNYGGVLDGRVWRWLLSMAADFSATLPDDDAAASALLWDIVPALTGSEIREAA